MRKDGKAERQHFIPQFILRNFADNRGLIHVLDKSDGRTFKANIRNVAAERNFYEVGESYNVEAGLTQIEQLAAPIINKIISERSLVNLLPDERGVLSVFLAIQSFRTNQLRDSIAAINQLLVNDIIRRGWDPNSVENFKVLDEEEVKQICVQMLAETGPVAELLADKQWMLIETTAQVFILGDHPIGMHNQRDFGPRGNLGFAVPGVEMYVPLTPNLALGLICPTDSNEMRRLQDENRQMEARMQGLAILGATQEIRAMAAVALKKVVKMKSQLPRLEKSDAMIDAMRAGTPILAENEVVEFMLYIQTRFASRYVYSATGDFSFIQKIIADDASLKKGVMPVT